MKIPRTPLCFLSLLLSVSSVVVGAEPASFPVTITVDASQAVGPLTPIWRFFGYDEANYTYMKDGQKLLGELGQLNGPDAKQPQVYVRCHHLLSSGDGSPALKWGSTGVYTQDAQGNAQYSWTIVDRIFDTYLQHGLKPYAQIGFMPEALSVHRQNYPHHPPADKMVEFNLGQAYPPTDYTKWGELVYQWVHHCVEKYGADQVRSWYWEVWNEPNIPYWRGTRQEYFELYDYSAAAVKRALPDATVGGPEMAGGAGGTFLHDFLQHCVNGKNYVNGAAGSPLDFVSFHAKGSPKFIDGHVRMGMSHQLADIDGAFRVIASFPQFKELPVVIGESDPEGCAACKGPQNGYRNGTMYSSYTAAVFPRKFELADQYKINLRGALTWAFEFENQPYFAGFRALATNGIDLPVLNTFRMFAKMTGQRVSVQSSAAHDAAAIIASGLHEAPDVSALASVDKNAAYVLVWHYDDDDLPGADAAVSLQINGLPAEAAGAKVRQFRIDSDHSNSFAAWQRMGSPENPDAGQYAQLESAGHLAELQDVSLKMSAGKSTISFDLPRQGVSLIIIRWDER